MQFNKMFLFLGRRSGKETKYETNNTINNICKGVFWLKEQ